MRSANKIASTLGPQSLVSARKESLRRLNEIEHRLELVQVHKGVEYINDAKAMDINSTWYSLEAINKPVIWICFGELDKQDQDLIKEIDFSRIKAGIVVGSEGSLMFETLAQHHRLVGRTETLRHAIQHAMLIAEENEVILFSPGCVDFQLYRHYKEAGQHFRKEVREVRL